MAKGSNAHQLTFCSPAINILLFFTHFQKAQFYWDSVSKDLLFTAHFELQYQNGSKCDKTVYWIITAIFVILIIFYNSFGILFCCYSNRDNMHIKKWCPSTTTQYLRSSTLLKTLFTRVLHSRASGLFPGQKFRTFVVSPQATLIWYTKVRWCTS